MFKNIKKWDQQICHLCHLISLSAICGTIQLQLYSRLSKVTNIRNRGEISANRGQIKRFVRPSSIKLKLLHNNWVQIDWVGISVIWDEKITVWDFANNFTASSQSWSARCSTERSSNMSCHIGCLVLPFRCLNWGLLSENLASGKYVVWASKSKRTRLSLCILSALCAPG